MTKMKDTYSDIDIDILYKEKGMYGAEIRALLAGKYEVIPKTTEHIKVDPVRCNGCELCMILCPCGCYEMENGKAVWRFGDLCSECGACQYVCTQVHAIDWSYPEAGTGVVLKYT